MTNQTNKNDFLNGLPVTVQLKAAHYEKWQKYSEIDRITKQNLPFYKKLQPFSCTKLEVGCVLVKQQAQKYNRKRIEGKLIAPDEINKEWQLIGGETPFWGQIRTATAFLVTAKNKSTIKSLCFGCENVEIGRVIVVDNGDELGLCIDTFDTENDMYDKYFIQEKTDE